MLIALITALQNDVDASSESGFSPELKGGLFLVLGLVLVFFGVRGLRRGTTKDKFGHEYTGGKAKLMSGSRLVIGLVLVVLGLYRVVAG